MQSSNSIEIVDSLPPYVRDFYKKNLEQTSKALEIIAVQKTDSNFEAVHETIMGTSRFEADSARELGKKLSKVFSENLAGDKIDPVGIFDDYAIIILYAPDKGAHGQINFFARTISGAYAIAGGGPLLNSRQVASYLKMRLPETMRNPNLAW